MKTPGLLWANLLVLALYSAVLTIWNGPFGHLSGAHLLLVVAHVTVLFLRAILEMLQQGGGTMKIVATAFIVGTVGGATCFYNFMSHMH